MASTVVMLGWVGGWHVAGAVVAKQYSIEETVVFFITGQAWSGLSFIAVLWIPLSLAWVWWTYRLMGMVKIFGVRGY